MNTLKVQTREIERDNLTFKEFKFSEGELTETYQHQYDKDKGWTDRDEVRAVEALRRKWAALKGRLAERQANEEAETLSFDFDDQN